MNHIQTIYSARLLIRGIIRGIFFTILLSTSICANAQESEIMRPPDDHITIDIERVNKEHKMREVVAGDTLHGRVEFRVSSNFSYAIFKDDDSEIIKGNMQATDGAFDNDTETFKVIAPTMPAGKYCIYLYTCDFRRIMGIENFRRSEKFCVQ